MRKRGKEGRGEEKKITQIIPEINSI